MEVIVLGTGNSGSRSAARQFGDFVEHRISKDARLSTQRNLAEAAHN